MKTVSDLFVLRDEQGPILYAPLNVAAARVNESGLAAVAKYLRGETLSPDESDVIGMLAQYKLFEPGVIPVNPERFMPVHVTLFPTDGCNLRCRYCYAGAEKIRHKMSVAAGRAAIDLVAENAREVGRDNFLVGFHGNGEPFCAYDRIREFCEYTQFRAEKTGIRGNINTATNGVLNDEQIDFCLAFFSNINVSFDGLPELQNRQRPFPDGSGSFDAVDHTLKRFDEGGLSFGIRATLTTDSVDALEDVAMFISKRYPHCSQLHLEPAWECGRCLMTGEHTPDVDVFIRKYLSAQDKLEGKYLKLVYSGARQDLIINSFCSVCRGSFTVTSEGYVTACYEVCEKSDPRSERYFYGSFDENAGCYVFDQQKMDALGRLNVENMDNCRDCFCRWHCAGDCSAKLLGMKEPEEHEGSARCLINRALTLRQLQKRMREREE